ncbi:MAG TPA: DUF362 domain-containing protein [Vicinamibacterales bacterium]|nr:DUF362 domain-containing protein [Vicinamibacterales bacterium]
MSSRYKLTRRELLKALPLAAALASCGPRPPYRRSDFVLGDRSAVGLYPAAAYDVDFSDVIFRGLQDFRLDVRGRSVLLKPNLVEYAPGTVINTHPLVVAGAATAFLRAGARQVVVGEAPGHRRDIEYLLSVTGLSDHLREMRIRFVDLNHDDVEIVPFRSHFTGLDGMALPVELLRADVVVSMPKLKTHHWAAMTCSMKNLFGVVPGAIYGWPKNILHYHGIENSILDLTATVRPQFTIVDAVTAMEGDGPIMGKPRTTGFIAMGQDLVAVDATCARIIGFDPSKMPYLSQASAFLGHIDEARIDQRGENPARYRTRFDVLEQFSKLQLPNGG